jgi:GntR family transcriptional repressor for pyruvate dehydrogenase complex
VAGPIYQGDVGGRNAPARDVAAAVIDWQALSPEPVRLSATVAGHIEEMIVSGKLPAGGRLPSERHLAELLGVSRGSVREAITALQVKGLVRRRPGSGTHVQPRHHSAFTDSILSGVELTDRETTELLDLREAIEPGIAARAAERATDEDLVELRSLEAQFASAETGQRVELDARFHHAIARATQNSLLVGMVERFMNALDATRRRSFQTEARWRQSKAAHARILQGIADHEPDAAEQAMCEHVRAVAAVMKAQTQEAARRRSRSGPTKWGGRP